MSRIALHADDADPTPTAPQHPSLLLDSTAQPQGQDEQVQRQCMTPRQCKLQDIVKHSLGDDCAPVTHPAIQGLDDLHQQEFATTLSVTRMLHNLLSRHSLHPRAKIVLDVTDPSTGLAVDLSQQHRDTPSALAQPPVTALPAAPWARQGTILY